MYPFQSDASSGATDATHDPDFPPVPLPSPRVLAVAGVALLRQLVRDHHDLLRQSEIADLPGHPLDSDEARYEAAVARAADYVVASCGGPPASGEAQRAFTLDEAGRAIWLSCLWQALADSPLPAALREEYWSWMEALSIRMLDRHTVRGQPRRYPFAQVRIGARPRGFAMCPR